MSLVVCPLCDYRRLRPFPPCCPTACDGCGVRLVPVPAGLDAEGVPHEDRLVVVLDVPPETRPHGR